MIKPLYQAWSPDPVQHAKVDPDPSLESTSSHPNLISVITDYCILSGHLQPDFT